MKKPSPLKGKPSKPHRRGGKSKRHAKATIADPESKHKEGRPPLLTPKMHAAIIYNVAELGMMEGSAGQAEGITPAAVSLWKTRGAEALANIDKLTPAELKIEDRYIQFFKALRDAEPHFEKSNLAGIKQAADKGDWRAHRERLRMRMPEKFGQRMLVGNDPRHPMPTPVFSAGAVLILPDNHRDKKPAAPYAQSPKKKASKKKTNPPTKGK